MNQNNQDNVKPDKKMKAHSQGTRRALFGSNVLLSIVVATGIVIGVNWIGRRAARRIDLTRIKSYTLSEQTNQVLADLKEEVTIVTLFDEKGAMVQEARHLLDEYGRASRSIKVNHISATDLKETTSFYQRIHKRFEEGLKQPALTVEKANGILEMSHEAIIELKRQTQTLVSKTTELKTLNTQLVGVQNALEKTDGQLNQILGNLAQELDDALPPYGPALAMQRNLVTNLVRQMTGLHTLFTRMPEMATRSGAKLPADAHESILAMVETFRQESKSLSELMNELKRAQVPLDYQRIRFHLKSQQTRSPQGVTSRGQSRNPLIVMGTNRLAPLTIEEDLFLQLGGSDQSKKASAVRIRHQGEERLTSTLAAMNINRMPLVVFCFPQMPSIDQQNLPVQYGYVIQALQRRGFEVKMHTPIKISRQGQQIRQKVPKPAKGQQAVWIFCPPPPDKPVSEHQIMGIYQGLKSLSGLMQERVLSGDSMMVMTSPVPTASYRVENPFLPMLSSYGINVKTDEIIIRELQTGTDQSKASFVHDVMMWPQTSAIGRAMRGLPAAFLGPSPIDIDASKIAKRHWVLAQIEGEEVWADKNFAARKYDPAKGRDKFEIGIAVEDDKHRMIVISGQQWLHDNLAAAGEVKGRLIARAAYMHGAKYPGNTDLFINSVLWLARQDQLILPAARSQDIARFKPMSIKTQKSLRLVILILVPIFFMAAGVAVYTNRRRG